jgi:hypothetical protein
VDGAGSVDDCAGWSFGDGDDVEGAAADSPGAIAEFDVPAGALVSVELEDGAVDGDEGAELASVDDAPGVPADVDCVVSVVVDTCGVVG